MNSSFPLPIPKGLAQNLQRVRAWLFAPSLAASAFAIAAAVALRAAAPASRLDLWLFLVALVCGAVAAVSATKRRRTALFRRTFGAVFAIGIVAYSVISAVHRPDILSAHELVFVRWFPPPPIPEEPLVYVFSETSNGSLGAKLPSGRGWTIGPPTETSLQAFGDGLRVRVEQTTVLPDEDLNDVAERLLADLAVDSYEVVTAMDYRSDDDLREAVVKEVQVWESEDASERRLLTVLEDRADAAVVVWVSGSFDDVFDHGSKLRMTLATATGDPERLASLRKEAQVKRMFADAPQKPPQSYRSRRGGVAGSLEAAAEAFRRRFDGR